MQLQEIACKTAPFLHLLHKALLPLCDCSDLCDALVSVLLTSASACATQAHFNQWKCDVGDRSDLSMSMGQLNGLDSSKARAMFECSYSILTGSNLCLAIWIQVLVNRTSEQCSAKDRNHQQPNAEEIGANNKFGLRQQDCQIVFKSMIDT